MENHFLNEQFSPSNRLREGWQEELRLNEWRGVDEPELKFLPRLIRLARDISKQSQWDDHRFQKDYFVVEGLVVQSIAGLQTLVNLLARELQVLDLEEFHIPIGLAILKWCVVYHLTDYDRIPAAGRYWKTSEYAPCTDLVEPHTTRIRQEIVDLISETEARTPIHPHSIPSFRPAKSIDLSNEGLLHRVDRSLHKVSAVSLRRWRVPIILAVLLWYFDEYSLLPS